MVSLYREHGNFEGRRFSDEIKFAKPVRLYPLKYDFAMTAGGGLDCEAPKHVSIRPAQDEYFMTEISDGLNNRQNNFRFGAGVVFRLGSSQSAASGLGGWVAPFCSVDALLGGYAKSSPSKDKRTVTRSAGFIRCYLHDYLRLVL